MDVAKAKPKFVTENKTRSHEIIAQNLFNKKASVR